MLTQWKLFGIAIIVVICVAYCVGCGTVPIKVNGQGVIGAPVSTPPYCGDACKHVKRW